MIPALFISDLHGSKDKYEFLFRTIIKHKPAAVFIGGDLMGFSAQVPKDSIPRGEDFLYGYLVHNLQKIKDTLRDEYPEIFVIMGNDDPKLEEAALLDISTTGLLTYVHDIKTSFRGYTIIGYSYVPPTPFLYKDWEKYDVSRFVDVGCVSPEEGYRSIPVSVDDIRYYTIKRDLEFLFKNIDLSKTIYLFHSPPYDTKLDRAALDGITFDHVPLDVHVGSIAIKEFILEKSPYLALHGHIHESTRLTGVWKKKIGDTICFQGASEARDNALILFDLDNPDDAERITG